MMAWSLNSEDRKDLQTQFEMMDNKKTGTITLVELMHVLQDNFEIDSYEAEILFQRMDVDNDQEIKYSEFLAATLQGRIGMNEDVLRRTFKSFDVDETGLITAACLREVLGD